MITEWLKAWRDEEIEIPSRLSAEEARERLLAAGAARAPLFARRSRAGAGFWTTDSTNQVVVDAEAGEIRLHVLDPGKRHSWEPILRCSVAPTPTGSVLAGTVGWPGFTKVFSALWFVAGSLAAAVIVIRAIVLAALGDLSPGDALVVVVPLFFMAFMVGAGAFGAAIERGQITFLKSWLSRRLEVWG
jgi:hypothetical protein